MQRPGWLVGWLVVWLVGRLVGQRRGGWKGRGKSSSLHIGDTCGSRMRRSRRPTSTPCWRPSPPGSPPSARAAAVWTGAVAATVPAAGAPPSATTAAVMATRSSRVPSPRTPPTRAIGACNRDISAATAPTPLPRAPPPPPPPTPRISAAATASVRAHGTGGGGVTAPQQHSTRRLRRCVRVGRRGFGWWWCRQLRLSPHHVLSVRPCVVQVLATQPLGRRWGRMLM